MTIPNLIHKSGDARLSDWASRRQAPVQPAARTWGSALRFVLALACASATLLTSRAADRITLFNGRDLAGWRPPTGVWQVVKSVALDPANHQFFGATPGNGVLVNNPKGHTVDLITTGEYGDLQAHIEFCIPSKSNSGIYFMGRYELQVYDSYLVAKDKYPGIECGGIYPRWTPERNEFEGHSPLINASKPPGQWQTFDVTFRPPRFDASGKKIRNASFVKVVHNGRVIHENVEVTGPTRAAVFDDEKPAGPIMLQGDHGPVAYRNLWVRPTRLE